jgi:hypothetical protein
MPLTSGNGIDLGVVGIGGNNMPEDKSIGDDDMAFGLDSISMEGGNNAEGAGLRAFLRAFVGIQIGGGFMPFSIVVI